MAFKASILKLNQEQTKGERLVSPERSLQVKYKKKLQLQQISLLSSGMKSPPALGVGSLLW